MTRQTRYVTGLPCRIAWIIAVSALYLSRAFAGSPMFEQGLMAYSRGDVAAAYQLWQPLAERGDADARYALGLLFYDGVGVSVDHTESSYWFLLAAEQGHAGAQYNLGNAYLRGDGVRRNEAMAVRWWKKAAEQGLADARFMLARAYQEGVGVEKDEQSAARLYGQLDGKDPPLGIAVNATFDRPVPSAQEDDCASWLGGQSPDAYTIQLISTKRREGAFELARQHKLDGYVVCSYAQKGYTSNALLLGVYPDAGAANEAIADLSPELKKNGPWVRKISGLRNLVAGKTR